GAPIMKLRRKIILSLVPAVLLNLALLGGWSFHNARTALRLEEAAHLASLSDRLRERIAAKPGEAPAALAPLLADFAAREHRHATISDSTGRLLAASAPQAQRLRPPPAGDFAFPAVLSGRRSGADG